MYALPGFTPGPWQRLANLVIEQVLFFFAVAGMMIVMFFWDGDEEYQQIKRVDADTFIINPHDQTFRELARKACPDGVASIEWGKYVGDWETGSVNCD